MEFHRPSKNSYRREIQMAFYPRPQHPCHYRFRLAIGYAARRGSEAGPVPGGRERRRLFQSGSAERLPSAGCCCCGRADGALRADKAVAERSCGQKPPNGALKGVTFLLSNAAALSAPSFACPKTTAVYRAWLKAVEADLYLPLEGGGRRKAAGGGDPLFGTKNHPTPALRADAPPQGEGGRPTDARSLSHVR